MWGSKARRNTIKLKAHHWRSNRGRLISIISSASLDSRLCRDLKALVVLKSLWNRIVINCIRWWCLIPKRQVRKGMRIIYLWRSKAVKRKVRRKRNGSSWSIYWISIRKKTGNAVSLSWQLCLPSKPETWSRKISRSRKCYSHHFQRTYISQVNWKRSRMN